MKTGLTEPPRDRKKVKNIAHSGDIPLDDIIEIARKASSFPSSSLFSHVLTALACRCASSRSPRASRAPSGRCAAFHFSVNASQVAELSGFAQILGTAQSVGCTIDGRPAHDVIEDVQSGSCHSFASHHLLLLLISSLQARSRSRRSRWLSLRV